MSGSFDTLSLLSLRELEFTREQAVAASQRSLLFPTTVFRNFIVFIATDITVTFESRYGNVVLHFNLFRMYDL